MGEPLNNPQLAILRSYSNVVVTPHTAFYTQEAVSDMVENSIICARAYINGEKTPYEEFNQNQACKKNVLLGIM